MNRNSNEKYYISPEQEFFYIYSSIIQRKTVSEEIVQLYINTYATYFKNEPSIALVAIKNLKFENIEFYLRLTRPSNEFTKRAKVVTYLAELDGKNYNLFFRTTKENFVFFHLIAIGFKTIYAFLSGFILCKVYGLK